MYVLYISFIFYIVFCLFSAYHLFRKKPNSAGNKGIPTFAPTSMPSRIPKDKDLPYNNGTVLVGPILTIYNIYFGSFKNTTMDLIDYFARLKIVKQYL